jgi:hypothetical protein
MSSNYFKALSASALLILLTGAVVAQPKDNSPFSRFGIGDFLTSSMPSVHGMGGLSSVYHDFFEANLDNPASLGFLQYTSLQVGVYGRMSSLKRYDLSQSAWSGNLDHLSLNVPLINPLNEALERRETAFSWGTSISLRPYSQVGYHVRLSDEIDSIGTVTSDFKGNGGIYQVSWGNGMKYKNLSLGIDLQYLYGRQVFDEQTQFPDLENSFNNIFQSEIAYKGFRYRAGLIYDLPLDLNKARQKNDKPSRFLSFGTFISSKSSFDTESNHLQIARNPVTAQRDTALYVTGEKADGILPGSWGVGLMYRHAGDFRIGVDYQAGQWSNYRNDARPYTAKDSHRFAIGASWIPDAGSITSYFKRVEYRAGIYTLTDPREIEGSQVKESAVSLAATLPLISQRNIGWFQIGLDVGRRTGGENLRDNFVRGKIGFIFNDNSWFIKRKYN